MTPQQRAALESLCRRYNVEFSEEDYRPQFDLPKGYIGGWVGGHRWASGPRATASRTTIYVGVSPEGEVSS